VILCLRLKIEIATCIFILLCTCFARKTAVTELELQLKSIAYRRTILRIIKQAGAGHTGGSLSCVDILNVLYNAILNVSPETFTDPSRDRYVQSKGHSVEALYTVLADRGFFPEAELAGLYRYQSPFIGHPTRKVYGIEQNTGALGHGLSVGVGMALAGKLDGRAYRVYVLLGDGELGEGSSWEASMTAAHYGLDNLIVIVDRNGSQITGSTEDVNRLEPLAAKFEAFGYAVRFVDGNDICALLDVLAAVPFVRGKPSLVLANTVKGKGVSFMENTVKWHHRVPNDEEYEKALAELDAAQLALVR
jgi:transketolase